MKSQIHNLLPMLYEHNSKTESCTEGQWIKQIQQYVNIREWLEYQQTVQGIYTKEKAKNPPKLLDWIKGF